jgi:4-diphosphocytidyl-2-C-methyl-D-erythritol kinase
MLKRASVVEMNILLVYPNIPISTKEIYSSEKLILTEPPNIHNMHIQLGAAQISELMFNGLESAVIALYPEIGVVKQALIEAGAMAAILSGSGSSVFGVFSGEEKASKAQREIRSRFSSYNVWMLKTPVTGS